MSEKLWYLKRCDLFERLTPDELRRVELASRARAFPRNSPIYLPADETDSVFLLASGRAQICHIHSDGKQSILAFIDPGELFGELALFEPGQREEYAEAAEPSTVVMIPGDEMRRLMAAHPDVTLGITKLIGLRRRRIERRLKNLLFLSNRERITHLLLELAEQYGRRTPEGVQLGIRLSHQELANVVGSTRETVTVILGELQNEGLIAVGRRKVTLLRPDAMSQSVQRPALELTSPRNPASGREDR
jgi:CRP/FNR family cyclic AMP-dependent transcriptional regulator